MRLASDEKSAISQPVHPSRSTTRRVPFASTCSGDPAAPPLMVTKSTVALPGAGMKQITGAALLGASSRLTASRLDDCQQPIHGPHLASFEANCVSCAPAARPDPSSSTAASTALVWFDFRSMSSRIVMIPALLEPDPESKRPRESVEIDLVVPLERVFIERGFGPNVPPFTGQRDPRTKRILDPRCPPCRGRPSRRLNCCVEDIRWVCRKIDEIALLLEIVIHRPSADAHVRRELGRDVGELTHRPATAHEVVLDPDGHGNALELRALLDRLIVVVDEVAKLGALRGVRGLGIEQDVPSVASRIGDVAAPAEPAEVTLVQRELCGRVAEHVAAGVRHC